MDDKDMQQEEEVMRECTTYNHKSPDPTPKNYTAIMATSHPHTDTGHPETQTHGGSHCYLTYQSMNILFLVGKCCVSFVYLRSLYLERI